MVQILSQHNLKIFGSSAVFKSFIKQYYDLNSYVVSTFLIFTKPYFIYTSVTVRELSFIKLNMSFNFQQLSNL
jgi:hypothetical protein